MLKVILNKKPVYRQEFPQKTYYIKIIWICGNVFLTLITFKASSPGREGILPALCLHSAPRPQRHLAGLDLHLIAC